MDLQYYCYNKHLIVIRILEFLELLELLTGNQIPSGSVGSNPTGCAKLYM